MIEEKLAQIHPNDYEDAKSVEIVSLWKERVPVLASKLDFKNHPVTTEIAQLTKREIERIKSILTEQENLSEVDRKSLFKEKKVHEFYLSLFTHDPSGELEVIERAIDKELEN